MGDTRTKVEGSQDTELGTKAWNLDSKESGTELAPVITFGRSPVGLQLRNAITSIRTQGWSRSVNIN